LKFLLFYFVCGFGASFLQILSSWNSNVPMLGASGAIAGIMGGYLALFPRHRIDIIYSFGFVARRGTVPAYFMLFYWFVAQLFYGTSDLFAANGGGVAYFAHIGGFITGYGLTKLLEKLLPLESEVKNKNAWEQEEFSRRRSW
jgi:membrane associated rhomboid family serine protease